MSAVHFRLNIFFCCLFFLSFFHQYFPQVPISQQNRPVVVRLRQFRLQRIAPGGIVFESHFQIIQREAFELGGAAGLLEFGVGRFGAVHSNNVFQNIKRRIKYKPRITLYAFRTTFVHPSNFSAKILYPRGPSANGSRCEKMAAKSYFFFCTSGMSFSI